MTDPTLTQALSTPCRRCGGMPSVMKAHLPFAVWIVLHCPVCKVSTTASESKDDAARQWVEMNKEVQDGL